MTLLARLTERLTHLAERGALPDALTRAGIRTLLRDRLQTLHGDDCELRSEYTGDFLNLMRMSPCAVVPEKANAQHYELPPTFFATVLGEHRKYSCAYWGPTHDLPDLNSAEAAALEMTCLRAGIADGMRILELGCGWGSLSLWIARHYPNAQVVAVSNSAQQGESIRQRANAESLTNLHVVTADMNAFDPRHALAGLASRSTAHAAMLDEGFDRVVSLEMFEHMRNWPELFARIHNWLRPGGRFFMHVFCHRDTPYDFAAHGGNDWMEQHFFSGGIMPSDSLALQCQRDLRLRRQWRWNGRHYQRTANAWLARMDANRHVLAPLFDATYGAEASIWWQRWRLFFMACAELFGYDHGQQWWVSHYLFERPVQSLDARPTHRFPTVHDGGRPTASKAATPADREAA
ncbi:MAG: class I SAM-dependent methyltransferase [Chromatiales bacterium]|nr:class I SAM-dependent methyltransferase [Gammaproteobacteria bacterium]MCP5351697.1 class I SAM-dependent methyltransferase [Chromatiales bacterium]